MGGYLFVFVEYFCNRSLKIKTKNIKNYQRWSRGHKARGQGQGHKKIRGQGQGQPFRGQTLSRPRTGMLDAKDQGHSRKCPSKNKVFKIFFQAISNLQAWPEFSIGREAQTTNHMQ